jgi:3alpha(or 20beta)-hydroxysteroid dehydrogenase
VALISGGARGMGAAHARALLAEGARVVIGDIIDDAGKALADELGSDVAYVRLDVTQPDQWDAAVKHANETFGPVSVLVNNAGIAHAHALATYALTEWQHIIDVNLTGTFLGCRAVAPTMIGNRAGSIINVSSIAGYRGGPGMHGYSASKFAVRGLTKSIALELAPYRIRANSIHPGVIRTDMATGLSEDSVPIPLGRFGEVTEASALVLYLASDESSYSTASEFVIDGGLLGGIPQ